MSLESDIKSMVESIGLKVYDTAIISENDETIYRIQVTSEDGVSLDKCVEATKLISPLLDVTPPVREDYRLEVSSPGIERKLRTLDHFKHSLGEKVKIITLEKEKIRGTMLRVEADTIVLETDEGESSVKFAAIAKASTYFEW